MNEWIIKSINANKQNEIRLRRQGTEGNWRKINEQRK